MSRNVALVCLTLTFVLRPSAGYAQFEAFVQAVRDLAEATERTEPSRTDAIRAAAHRTGLALNEWDRHIAALETRVDREMAGATEQRAHQLHVELGVAYRARGRLHDALREFDAAAALRPSASDLQVLRAMTLETAGRPADAGQAFRTAWNLDTRNPVKAYYVIRWSEPATAEEHARARALLTDAYQGLASDATPRAAAPFLTTLGAISDSLWPRPVVADAAMTDGFVLLSAGKYKDAVTALQRTDRLKRAKTEESALAHFALGQREEARNRVAEARREYQSALTGTVLGRSLLYVGMARLAQVDGDLDGAIDAFAHAVRLNPNDPNIHKELASAYAAHGRVDDAFYELMAALLINPRDAQAHAAIGQLYLDTGNDAAAATAFARGLELMPDGYETRYALATALMHLGRTSEAAHQLDAFERLRLEALEQRRRDIADDVEQQEAIRRSLANQGAAR